MMLPIGDFHTHTCFCDGKNTPAEMAAAAVRMGLTALGISSHMPISCYENDWCMTHEGLKDYIAAVRLAKEQFRDQIALYLGLEADTHGDALDSDTDVFDYRIGSVHSVLHDGRYIEVDGSADTVREAIATVFGGNGMDYVRAYYAQAAQIVEKTHCQIIGHIDVATKFSEREELFDAASPQYYRLAFEALETLRKSDSILEINTGSISRGYLSHPYPAMPLLRFWHSMGGEVVINSDAHNTARIASGFDDAVEYAREAGYHHTMTMQNGVFCPVGFD